MSGKTTRQGKQKSTGPGRRRIVWLPAGAGAIIVIGAMLWAGGLLPSGSSSMHQAAAPAATSHASSADQPTLPAFLGGATSRVKEAYTYAAMADSKDLEFIPCYCGCGAHSGHRWVRDCFVKDWTSSGINWDSHAANCDICVSIALEAKKRLGEGQSVSAVRKFIDGKYGSLGPGTNTPLPPG
jgi:hypothetical protein